MFPVLHDWDKKIFVAALAAMGCGSAFGQEPDSMISATADSLAKDSVVLVEDSSAALLSQLEVAPAVDSSAENKTVESLVVENQTAENPVVENRTAPVTKPLKTVLYLSGGDNSPWFHLGVLYAIEEYRIPVDSVVGTSWGAWVGSMWAKGVPLDEIQRLLLSKPVAPIAGKDVSAEKTVTDSYEVPLSLKGVPSLRKRYSLQSNADGKMVPVERGLIPDSAHIERAIAKLATQEALLRQNVVYSIPFDVVGCDGISKTHSLADVFKSLPFLGNEKSGELCPYLALPAEDNASEFPIIVVADPLRGTPSGSPAQKELKMAALQRLQNQPGVVIRPHSVADTARSSWIQAGFSALEARRGEFAALNGRKAEPSAKHGAVPWFRFNPTFDSLSAELHGVMKSYWDFQDTGLVVPQKFAYEISERPAFDSVAFDMQTDGSVAVSASVHPTFDVAVGGFGSNVFGPNAYAELSMNYVNQMEFDFTLAGFYGLTSYGFSPRFVLSRLWKKQWSFAFAYDFIKWAPVKSYNEDLPFQHRIYSESRNDLSMALRYQLDERQLLAVNFLFGSHTFRLDSLLYRNQDYDTYPVSPYFTYQLTAGAEGPYFSEKGYAVFGKLGMQSIGFSFGLNEIIPIYWTVSAEARGAISPRPFLTFGGAVAGGVDQYHKPGYGYVYPESFQYGVLDNCYRLQPKATPWTSEWYDRNLASHHYGLIRGNAGLHYHGNGLWLFAAYMRDFEENPTASMNENRFVLEPSLRFKYKSLSAYLGLSRIVDSDHLGDLGDFKNYKYFIRIGNYDVF